MPGGNRRPARARGRDNFGGRRTRRRGEDFDLPAIALFSRVRASSFDGTIGSPWIGSRRGETR
jgi:hypothetical protein